MKNKEPKDISRKEALGKIGTYGKYAALTAIGTYMILDPKKAQAQSGLQIQVICLTPNKQY